MVARQSIAAFLLATLFIGVPTGVTTGVFASERSTQGCCAGVRGNVNGQGIIDLSDLSALVLYLTTTGYTPPCMDAANVNGQSIVDISDLSLLIGYLTTSTVALPPCPSDSGQITDDQRMLLLASIDSVEATLTGVSDDSMATALVSYFNSRGEYEEAGREGVSVWARFIDGRVLMIPNNREPTGSIGAEESGIYIPAETEVPAGYVPPKRRFEDWDAAVRSLEKRAVAQAASTFELPQSLQARVISTLGVPCFTVGTTKAQSLLGSRNYSMTSSSGTVATLSTASGDGVFYIDAHCGTGKSRGNALISAIWTSTLCTISGEAAYDSMLDAAELVYMKMKDRHPGSGTCVSHWRYAFTGKFVGQYMSFAQHSFVLINACESDRVSLKQGFTLAGASVYAAWTLNVTDPPANKAGEYLLDRMLGTNASTLTPVENPPQRPFDITQLWQVMKNLGYDTDPSNGSKLIVTKLQGSFELLAPSIRFMAVLEHQDTLEMNGYFGSNPGSDGKLIIGGTELPIGLWEPGIIQAFIPNTGAGSVGPVTVEIDGRVSNVVNLTEWNGLITYHKYDAGSLKAQMEIHLHLRADVHKFRDAPGQPPQTYTLYIAAAEDSYGECFAEGTYTYHIPDSDPPDSIKYDWSQSVFLPGLWEQNPAGFFFQGQLDPVARTWKPQFAAVSDAGLKEDVFWSGGTDINFFNLAFYSGLYDEQFFSRLHFSFDAQWNLNGRIRQENEDCCSRNPDLPEIWHDYVWPNMTASFPPDPNAAQ
ncbi:MAG: hypothetical protein NDJ18_05745 [candidate division Zixibacteria bacterium]|nr:hypothetical protein [candidate division Zixibacteria bacterium]